MQIKKDEFTQIEMKDNSIKVLHVCSEYYPFLKTGGLADVTAALPPELAKLNCDCRVLLPGFTAFMKACENKVLICELPPKFGADSIKIYEGTFPNSALKVCLIDVPSFYDRSGSNPYLDEHNVAYPDNYRRFALLSWIASQIACDLDPNWRPDVIHAHDWHTGLTAAYIHAIQPYYKHKLAGTIFTVHNLAYQGLFPAHILNELDLPESFYSIHGLEFHGQISFLKAGLFYSDHITTVSPNYAKEIQEEEQGCGLHGLLKYRKNSLQGIINGVDPEVWNPSKDTFIPYHYDATDLSNKAKCKAYLQTKLGLISQESTPIFVVISRLTEQKGLHLVLQSSQNILNQGGQIVILGTGEKELEEGFKALAQQHPESVSVHIKYDETLAHQIIAGGDVILVPSRYEPCGLTQLYGMLYGCLPLVHKVGGLADTVTNASPENIDNAIATGFVFDTFDINAYNSALEQAFVLYKKPEDWQKLVKTGMSQNLSWQASAKKYVRLYQEIILQRAQS